MRAFRNYQSSELPGTEKTLVPRSDTNGSDAGNAGTNAPERISPADRAEMEMLRRRLEEQEEATKRAISSAAALETALASAKSEADKMGKQYHGFSKEAGEVSARRATEIATLSTQCMKAERELGRLKVERKVEAEKAAEKLASLERELMAAADRAATAQQTDLRRKVTRTMVSVTAVVALVCLSAIYWPVLARQGNGKAPVQAAVGSPSTPAPFTPQPGVQRTVPLPEVASPVAAFSTSLNRLDTAFAKFPGRAPEEILREASKEGHGCMLSWNEGRPSVVFGSGSATPASLSATIDRCAEDISRLR